MNRQTRNANAQARDLAIRTANAQDHAASRKPVAKAPHLEISTERISPALLTLARGAGVKAEHIEQAARIVSKGGTIAQIRARFPHYFHREI